MLLRLRKHLHQEELNLLAHLNGDYAWQRLACVGSALYGDAQSAGVLHHLNKGGDGRRERGQRGADLLGHKFISSVSWNQTSNL